MNIREEFEKNKNLVTRKETNVPGLFVLKYKRKVFYNDIWNNFLRECRGMIIDNDWNIVSLPFKKIHNFGIEKDAPKFDPEEAVFASRKVNGFMIAVTLYNNELLWSTTGSIDSEFIGFAKEIYNSWTDQERISFKEKLFENLTFMFECVHPSDPHIVHEEPGLYFIGYRPKKLDSNPILFPEDFESHAWAGTPVKVVETFTVAFKDLQTMAKKATHEGFVFENLFGDDYRCSKIKSPHYLTKKALMRGNWEKFLNKTSRNVLDEEFIPLFDHIHNVEKEKFFEMDEMTRRSFIENWFK